MISAAKNNRFYFTARALVAKKKRIKKTVEIDTSLECSHTEIRKPILH